MKNLKAVFSQAVADVENRRPAAKRAPHAAPTTGVAVTRNDLFNDPDKQNTAPVSKRQNKNKGPARSKANWNAQRWVQAVGGTSDTMKAIYADADKELCVVVDSRRGFRPDGTPFRF